MRTTLKRGIGRAAAVNGNGNGRATLPPATVAPVTRYLQPVPTRSGWARVGRFFVWLLALVVMVAAATAGGAYLYYHETVVGGLAAHSKDVKIASKKLDIPLPNQPAIALVVGYDKRLGDAANGSRSDTIMLLRVDPVSKSISMLSFPRDLTTQLWCGDKIVGTDRINGAYSACGSKGTLETVKHLTGLPVNYLITVNFHGFKQIVDRIGGIWVDVDRRYYNQNTGTAATNYADINLWPGYQKLNGAQALDYVRFRHTDSDLFRIARQQQFVKAIKLQLSQNFSVFKALKVVGAITHSVEIGQAGGGSLEKAIQQYALLAYSLPAGHFIQAKIEGIQGQNMLTAPPSAIAAAVADFQNPDVQAAQKATAVTFGRKAAGLKAPPPTHVTVSVVNGNGIPGSATNASYGLSQRGYQINTPQNTVLRNAPTFDYFHTKVYFDHTQPQAHIAAQKVADLFGDGEVEQLPPAFFQRANGSMVTVVVGSTFHGARADAGRQDAGEAARERAQRSRAVAVAAEEHSPARRLPADGPDGGGALVADRLRGADPDVLLQKAREGRPADVPLGERCRRLLGHRGDEMEDAPVLQQPNFKHMIKGREYDFYYTARTSTWSSCASATRATGWSTRCSTRSRTRR